MLYTVENSLENFEFWSGAKDNAKMLTRDELEQLDSILEDIWCDRTPSETEINDLFWFEFDTVCDLLGYKYDHDTGDIIRDEEEEDDDEL